MGSCVFLYVGILHISVGGSIFSYSLFKMITGCKGPYSMDVHFTFYPLFYIMNGRNITDIAITKKG